jgi:arylsulfatase A-like enzyme/Flp pilus assembly protein TadD
VVVFTAVAVFLLRSESSTPALRQIPGANVLLVTIDTLRADAPSSYGGPAATPALDRLAADGVRFAFAHAHAVMTLPSHASILTGRLPFQHGLRDNSGFRLPADARTVATILKRAGYTTAGFVAAFPLHSRFGLSTGFDVYDDRVGEENGLGDFNMPERPASSVVPLARDWIAGRATGAGQPWFAWVHVFEPHAPYLPPAPFNTQYATQPYYGEVAAADAALAPLLDDVRGIARPTLVIVTSDHGEGLGDHGEATHGIFAYESTLRVPLVIAQVGGGKGGVVPTPAVGRAATGEVSFVAARHIDILPTILEAVGQPEPSDLPGRSLLSRRERTVGAAIRPTYFEAMSEMLNHGWAPLTGVLLDRDKFIDLPVPERYDLATDPDERANVAHLAPERDRVLEAALASFRPSLPGQRIAEDPEAVDRLRALGYVSGTAPAKVRYSEADDPKRLVALDGAVQRGVQAVGEGRFAEAAEIYRQVIERRPGMAIAYRHLAFIAWQQGDSSGAIDVLRKALAQGVTDPRVHAQLGNYLTNAGRLEEGIRILEPLASSPAADAETLNALAIAYVRTRRADDARRVFERLLSVMKGSNIPLENLGVLALQQGDLAGAREYFARALAIAPGSSRARTGAGAVAFQGGDRRVAYEEWARAVQIDPTNLDALYSLGVNLARDGRMDLARPYLEQFQRTASPAVHASQLRDVSRLLQTGR